MSTETDDLRCWEIRYASTMIKYEMGDLSFWETGLESDGCHNVEVIGGFYIWWFVCDVEYGANIYLND